MICPTQQDHQVVQMLMGLARPGAPAGESSAKDYDWTVPYSFSRQQLDRLGDVADKFAQKASEIISGLTQSKVQFQPQPMGQHFEWKLTKEDMGSCYVISLNDEQNRPAGFLRLSADTASQWVAKLLGAAVSSESRDLSALESTLLLDLVAPIVQAFGVCLDLPAGKGLRLLPAVERKYGWPGAEDSREYGEFGWTVQDVSGTPVALYVSSQWLAGCCGQKEERRRSNEEVRKDLLKYLDNMHASGLVWLGTATVPVRDVLSLKPGDVVLLSTELGQSVEFHIEGRRVLMGTPASRDGNYAIQVVRRC